MQTRVMLLGAHSPAVRHALATSTPKAAFHVVADATTTDAVRRALHETQADAAIVAARCEDGPVGGIFDLVASLPRERRPDALLMISAREEDAVRAFELEATDFLAEPVVTGRLRTAMTRVRQSVLRRALLRTADELERLLAESEGGGAPAFGPERRNDGDAETPHGAIGQGEQGDAMDLERPSGSVPPATVLTPPRSVLVREGRRTRFVPLSEVDWFEADGNYIVVHAGGERYRTRGTIASIEAGLDPRQFARIHRRIVVNMDRVRELSPLPGGDGLLRLGGGATLRLSRTYRRRVT